MWAERDAEAARFPLWRGSIAIVRAACRMAEKGRAVAGQDPMLCEAGSFGIAVVQTFAAGLSEAGRDRGPVQR